MFGYESMMAVAARPRLWVTAVGAVAALALDGWWRRPPFLPLPDEEMLRWRLTTAYGSPDHAVAPDDLVAYLEWRRRQRSTRR